ncbi:two pore domain potassium channel family protein [Yersinia enterocolitica]|uniref:ion channel n=1 Tax=Yersinia enterocolitica TaxID=630 RepID=UPI002911D780|nr:two pore domain potassium channel family protein [Yersinia enterocolitica]HEB2014204.1 two pore domain potassium channel family protein [Yersinia enterocolitica]HEN3559586.1 two pore domain potassium channel family protein [Yersinia enterocolitica]
MKIKNKAAITYSLIIVFFAAVYYFTWSVYPDSFIKNNALNSTPIHNAINLAFSYNGEGHQDYDNISNEDFSKETLKAKNEFDRIIRQNIELESVLSQQESKLKLINANLSKAWTRNTQAYVDEASLKNHKELNIKEDELKAILSQRNKIQESQFDIILADKNIEISEVNLRIATSKRDALEYVLSHVGDFNDPRIVFELNATNKIIDDTRYKLIRNDKEIIKIKNNVQYLLGKRQKEDLNFLDFAFYSIGISTTTTFGDLVANSRLIRMLVCIQLLLSILVLANVTQSFLSKNKNSL